MIVTVTPNPLLNYEVTADGRSGGHRVRELPFTVGGKGINVARLLKTMGRPALVMTFLGGATGRKVGEKLRDQGIMMKCLAVEAETRVGISLFGEDPVANSWWLEEGENLREADVLSFVELFSGQLPEISYLVLSGTVPGNAHQSFYRRILRETARFPVKVFLDAAGPPLQEALKIGGFFLKHNREECRDTLGVDPFHKGDRPRWREILGRAGVWGSMVTDGPGDVILWDGENLTSFTPPSVSEKSAVGSGDATMAGLVYGLAEGLDLTSAATWGIAAGAADAACIGPCVAEFSRIEALYRHVQRGSL